MKKRVLLAVMIIGLVANLFGGCSSDSADKAQSTTGETKESSQAQTTANKVYPSGKLVMYGYGQPQYVKQYYDTWLEKNKDIAPDVQIEMVQTKGAAESREKITLTNLSGAFEDLPDMVQIDVVNLIDLAKGNVIKDLTDFVKPLESKLVDGAANDATIDGRIYGLPDSVRPQMLFYNQSIFEKYGIDPAKMSTIEGYLEVGKELKEKSSGKVYLSYIDPGSKTWRYYGRRGLLPQANAKIWDENGNVIIDTDPGAKLAFGALDSMYSQGMLLKSVIMEPALYDSIRKGEVATFYIGAFWDEFLRKNVSETAGQWRVMDAPVFKDVGAAGAPVPSYYVLIEKKEAKYTELCEKMWYDFHFDNQARIDWVNKMEEQNAPYANPITLDMLTGDFWKAPSTFYGGQSFRQSEGEALDNGAANLVVAPQDAEADGIISAELEKYIAGAQTMDEAIANMGKNLRDKIGKAEIVK